MCVCVASKETSRKKLPRKLNANLVAWFLVFPASVSKLKAIAYHNLVNDSRVKVFCCEELLWNGILYKIERWLCPRIKTISNKYFQNLSVKWGNGERSKTFGKSAPAVPYSILSSFKLPFTIHALSQLSHVIGKTRKKWESEAQIFPPILAIPVVKNHGKKSVYRGELDLLLLSILWLSSLAHPPHNIMCI